MIMNPAVSTKQTSQRVIRHLEYYIHGGDAIFRVCGFILSAVSMLNNNALTGREYFIPSTSLLLYTRLGILP
jgi:hypothetical protein